MTGTDWRRSLGPWLAALREASLRIDLPPLATASDMEKLWLAVAAPRERRNNPAVWSQLIEAMELLELLARVDYAQAWRLLFDIADKKALWEQYGAHLLPDDHEPVLPRFLVQIDGEELLEGAVDTVQGCIRLVVENEVASVRYQRAKEALLKVWRAQQQQDECVFDRETEGRVQLTLEFEIAMDFANEVMTGYVFDQIKQIAYAHNDPGLLFRLAASEDDEAVEQDGDDDDEQESNDDEEDKALDADHEQVQGEANDGEDVVAATTEPLREHGEREQEADGDGEERNHCPATNPNAPPRGALWIVSFRFCLLDHPVSNMALYMVNEAGKLGMRMSHVTLSTVLHERLHHSVIGGFLLNQLAPWRGRRDELAVENLTIETSGFDAAGVRAFCTAIAHSGSLREFHFKEDAIVGENELVARGDVWWPWLAFALFSADADNQIHTVSLSVQELNNSHVQAIREVLGHENPLAFLFQRAIGVDRGHDVVSGSPMAAGLSTSAFLRLGHHRVVPAGQADSVPGLRVQEPGVTYQVVRNNADEDYIEILLPGTGVCWTDRSEVIELKPLARRSRHSIRHLTILSMNRASASAVAELLELIGDPLDRLTIQDQEGTMESAVLKAIRASCRNVKRLDLQGCMIENFEWLTTESYDSWTLEALSLQAVGVGASDGWSKLFAALRDPTRALAISLRQLNMSPPINRSNERADFDLVEFYVDLLNKNHRLVRCEMCHCSTQLLTEFKHRVVIHHGEPLCVEKAPLPPAAKLALLSVLTPPGDDCRPNKQSKRGGVDAATDKSAQFNLDVPVLRAIMAMAAQPEHRISGITGMDTMSQAILTHFQHH